MFISKKTMKKLCSIVLVICMFFSLTVLSYAFESTEGEIYSAYAANGIKLWRPDGGAAVTVLDTNAGAVSEGTISVNFDGYVYEAGIVFRYTNDQNYMRAAVNWANGSAGQDKYLVVTQFVNGKPVAADGVTEAHLVFEKIDNVEDAELKVTFDGSKISVSWAGTTVKSDVAYYADNYAANAPDLCGVTRDGNTSNGQTAIVKSLSVVSGGNPYVNNFTSTEGLTMLGTSDATQGTVTLVAVEGGMYLWRADGGEKVVALDTNAGAVSEGTISVTFDGYAYEAGIIFRYTDDKNYIRAAVNWANGSAGQDKYLVVTQFVNGKPVAADGVTEAHLVFEKINNVEDAELKVTFDGSKISVSWAGTTVKSDVAYYADNYAANAPDLCGVTRDGDTSNDRFIVVEKFTVTTDSTYVNTFANGNNIEVIGTDDAEKGGVLFNVYGGGVDTDTDDDTPAIDPNTPVSYTNGMSSLSGLKHVKYSSTSALEKVSGGVKFSRDQGTGRTLFVDKNSPNATHGSVSVKIAGTAYEAGVVFRYVDENNFSYAFVNWDGKLIHVYQVINGEAIPLATSLQCESYYSTNGLSLTVDYVGKQIAISINGSTIWAETCENAVEVAGKIGVINNGDSSMAGYTGAFVVESLSYNGVYSYLAPETGDNIAHSIVVFAAILGGAALVIGKRKKHE